MNFGTDDNVVLGSLFRQMKGFVLCIRMKQWTKNLLVFAALMFSVKQASVLQFEMAFLAFGVFCIVSSGVYLLNDFMDREADRLHPQKCKRPMASGILNPAVGLIGGLLFFIVSIAFSFTMSVGFGLTIIAYFLNNVLYSLKIKHIVLLDVMSIAFGFALRAIGGGVAIDVSLTPWFLLCVFLLSLFLALGKRRHELSILESESHKHRAVLENYSVKLLDQLIAIVTCATIMCYSLFTFTAGRPIELMITIPLVVYGIFRYLYLIQMENEGGAPEKIFVGDKPILVTVLLYCLAVVAILSNASA